jgi:hypothetical protein
VNDELDPRDGFESRDSLDARLDGGGRARSRKAFRWMPGPVLWHNVPIASPPPPRSALGRNLYGRKLREQSDPSELSTRTPSEVLRWQVPFAYLVVARGGRWLLTWHAPWCRRCDCPGAGWGFARASGYLSGLGFELSYARSEPPR